MKSVSAKDMVRILLRNGFIFERSKGSHQLYIHESNGKRTVVPMHAGDLKKGTLHAILKQSGLDESHLI